MRRRANRSLAVAGAAVALTFLVAAAAVALMYGTGPRRMLPVGDTARPGTSAVGPTQTPTASVEPTAGPSSIGTPSVEPTAPPATEPPDFDASAALADVTALARIGVRQAGGTGERRGAELIAKRLTAAGYDPEVRTFKLPNGRTSRNVVLRVDGGSERVVVLGAHMDSKSPSPGANDNASGCGVLLEVARQIAGRPLDVTVEFVFFGSEEAIDADPDHHHYGSRAYVKSLSSSERAAIGAMISVDMVGVGTTFTSRTMSIGPKSLSDLLVRRAKAAGIGLSYLRDPSSIGWSDHEPFERIGIPVSWLEWRNDPHYHTARDTADRVKKSKLRAAGDVVLEFVLDADAKMLKKLRAD